MSGKNDAQAQAAGRLQHIGSQLDGENTFFNPNRLKYAASLPKGRPVNNTPLNPLTFLLRSAYIRPQRIAMKHPAIGVEWTYSEWAMRVCALAYGLKKRGIKPGERVAVICPNVPMILDLIQAVPAVHGVIVPMNIRLTKAEVNYILEHSGAVMVVADHEFAHLAADFKGPVIVSKDSGGRDPTCQYEQLIEEGRHEADTIGWQGHTLIEDEESNYAICYTSGTTGRPKGVVTTYRGTYLAALSNAMESRMFTESTYLWILPAFHAMGWTFPFAVTAASSGQVCLRSVGDYSPIWESFSRDKITHYCAAPTVQIGICNHPQAHKITHDIRTLVAGAAPSAFLINTLEKKLGIQVIHVYGLTETYGPMTNCIQHPEWAVELHEEEFYRRKAMQGHAFVGADEARVIRPESDPSKGYEDVTPNGKEVGEIVMRGNIVMKEYWNNPEATAEAFEGGWFHSGDLAVRMPYGMISIQDRSKDIIISGGENASSLSIESAIYQHPDVLECAVVARPHEKFGERAHAFIILRPHAEPKWAGKEDEFHVELKTFVKPLLPGFARPEWVEVVPELPKTSTGKIQKHELRKRFKSIIPGQ
ncbi:acetyl-CoA synthetase-like protein [Cutaneotrichosporon oleaginosum]|uniref:Acetyl-CoA synthetase-like protein n=1 Tax=Cutaneotrichosporon oleaginosum TaxID=879819 RepID=A0A0J0XEW9_9TREE|nr:acetyl-CoA synthetase-like protein [Cutaneotrichosporon oleaginosum]KLT39610.1 acetyl-CoA synthetase-like protein [Cutaneotrichosporon oleaginosum]TXT15463.1 hypothetical protein COLE_01656 [Cutaneotrichosporon oleaginosum]